MYDLANFRLSEMVECAAHARTLGAGAHSMQEAADRIVGFLYDAFGDPATGRSACALVRFFKTHPYGDIPQHWAYAADRGFQSPRGAPFMKCLVLLATRGDEAEWNNPRASRHHCAIPLPSEEIVEQAPMIAQLIKQLGLTIGAVIRPDPSFLLESQQTSFNVFHVPEAHGSPYIPAQKDFVARYGIRSVLGFGGVLPTGHIFATVMFAKVSVPHETAELFRTLALNVKLAILPFMGDRVFADFVAGEKHE